jgi:DNA-binding LytR/AlgR family response regulator
MTKKNVLVLEDDPLFILKLEIMLEDSNFCLIGTFDNIRGIKGFLEENKQRVDILISDIYIGATELGSDLIHEISPAAFPILCITSSFDEKLHFNLKGLVSNYLVKPFHKISLIDSLNRAIDTYEEKKLYEFVSDRFIFLSIKAGLLRKVNFVDIIYLESSENYTFFHTRNGKFAKKSSLSRILNNSLDNRFIRVHHKYVVNTAFIIGLSIKEVLLSSSLSLPVSRGFRENLCEFMLKKKSIL